MILLSNRFFLLLLTTFALLSGQSSAAIYNTNPATLNKQEFAYLNQYVGKFILRTERTGQNDATENQFKSCTATLIAPTWILPTAHCLVPPTAPQQSPPRARPYLMLMVISAPSIHLAATITEPNILASTRSTFIFSPHRFMQLTHK